jgi:N-glycosylase/DNA lyase
MGDLVNKIESLKNSDIKKKITKRIKEFKKINRNSSDELFNELCYCILTARTSAEKCFDIDKTNKDIFLTGSYKEIFKKLKQYSYPLASQRAKYISNAFRKKDQLKENIQSLQGEDLRYWVKKNFLGIGYKEASHFLRNIGFDDYAIIDRHIVDLLVENKFIKKPKNPYGKNTYLKIEHVLRNLSREVNLSLAELDLYLWYLETKKIFK